MTDAAPAVVEAVQQALGCRPYDGPWNALNMPVCDRHFEEVWNEGGCPVAVAAAVAAVTAARPSIRAEALRDYAAELDWKQPEAPCADPEPCCGSAASCDAMQPSVRVVGASSLRDRADREERP